MEKQLVVNGMPGTVFLAHLPNDVDSCLAGYTLSLDLPNHATISWPPIRGIREYLYRQAPMTAVEGEAIIERVATFLEDIKPYRIIPDRLLVLEIDENYYAVFTQTGPAGGATLKLRVNGWQLPPNMERQKFSITFDLIPII